MLPATVKDGSKLQYLSAEAFRPTGEKKQKQKLSQDMEVLAISDVSEPVSARLLCAAGNEESVNSQQ